MKKETRTFLEKFQAKISHVAQNQVSGFEFRLFIKKALI